MVAFPLSNVITRFSIFRQPCELYRSANSLRAILNQHSLPCEFRVPALSFDCRIKPFSLHSEADFAFYMSIVGIEPTADSLKWSYSTNELYCATYDDVLPQLRHTLLEYSIQHTKYLSSCGLISHISRTMSKPSHHPLILDRSPWLQHLGQLPYPFSYQLVSWFCSEVSTTCYFPLTQVPLPEGQACRPKFFPLH